MGSDKPLICGFIKVKDELLRGNIRRALVNLRSFCDVVVAADDASVDGTRQLLQQEIPSDRLILIRPEDQAFEKELKVKQQMLDLVHDQIKPKWIWWHDGDEELDPEGVRGIRELCESDESHPAFRFHYVQLWRNRTWARVDDGFGDGYFVKLWRWSPELSFDIIEKTHHAQFPIQLMSKMDQVPVAPWKVIHWGNYGVNLRWKAIQYHGGLGGVDRHLDFENGAFERVSSLSPSFANEDDNDPKPVSFTPKEKLLIKAFEGLKKTSKWFTVVIPTHNRAWALPQTLESLLSQTYPKWIALVLDDGSTDETSELMAKWQERDPRIFYGRYDKLGAVAMNEIGMDCAIAFTEYWARLGSDDYFEPNKLMRDALALQRHEFVYGPYRVLRDNKLEEVCNLPLASKEAGELLRNGTFLASWANVAARSELLRKAKQRFGTICDPRLRSMEDFLVNSRLARFADPVWRGTVNDEFVVDPTDTQRAIMATVRDQIEHDAIWRVSTDGASSNTTLTGNEDELTRQIIDEDKLL